MQLLKWIVGIPLLAALAIGGLAIGARFGDGPLHMFPGGALQAGTLVTEPVANWSFVGDVDTIEMQLIADGDRSRTTWILFHEEAAYLPVTLGFPPRKGWHHLAAAQGAAIVRIQGRRYPVTLTRIEDVGLLAQLDATNSSKYPPAPGSDKGSWYFRLDSRAP